MPSDLRRLRSAASVAALVSMCVSCQDAVRPLSSVSSPSGVSVQAVALNAVRVEWQPIEAQDVTGYRVERRENLAGPFQPLPVTVPHSSLAPIVFLDTDVEPDTYYGYRVVAVARLGERSRPSVVGGARTPPWPGVDVRTLSNAPNPASADPDGYRVVITGPDTASAAIGLNEQRRFSPLPPGDYTVTLRGVLTSRCDVRGDTTRTLVVSDTGLNTISGVTFSVDCRDPSRGQVFVGLVTSGDSADSDGFYASLLGIASDATLPDSARVVSRRSFLSPAGGSAIFGNLLPGAYEIVLEDVAGHCAVAGGVKRNVASVQPLATDTVRYQVTCGSQRPDDSSRPLVWKNSWSAASAAQGQRVTLIVAVDATARPQLRIAAAQGEMRYDPSVLRIEKVDAFPGGLDGVTPNSSTPGAIFFNSTDNSGLGKAGVVAVARMEFTVIGAPGTQAITRSRITEVVTQAIEQYQDSTRIVEDTLVIGSGGGSGGGANQSPRAEANGPYAGIAGSVIAFSSAGTSDPDGTIASYVWTFGDGASASGSTTSHAYAAAGTYVATLIVTDDDGASASDQAQVTVNSSTGGNLPPVARANGPYNGTAGAPVTFSANGSSDPDGTIVSYQWTFGDGSSASGATVSHSYAAAGAYTASLSVTDNGGASGSAQASVSIAAGGGAGAFVWSYSVGTINPADSIVAVTITYDLSTDIPETPGPEALQSWAVNALTWDPAVLRYFAFNFGPGGSGSVNNTDAQKGKLVFQGTQPASSSTGVITIATIRFKAIGARGSSSTTQTMLGGLIGTPATGSYSYTSRTTVREAHVSAP